MSSESSEVVIWIVFLFLRHIRSTPYEALLIMIYSVMRSIGIFISISISIITHVVALWYYQQNE